MKSYVKVKEYKEDNLHKPQFKAVFKSLRKSVKNQIKANLSVSKKVLAQMK